MPEVVSALMRTQNSNSTSPMTARSHKSRGMSLTRSPSTYQEAVSGKMHKFVTDKSKRLYEQILATRDDLNAQVSQMDRSLQGIIDSNEYDYLQAYNIFVKRKEEELKGMID